MNSQTSLVASDFRLRQWASEIQACQNRPVGMEVQEWLKQNNISKHAYYYHLKKVREACLEMTGTDQLTEFVELPVEPVLQNKPVIVSATDTSAQAATLTLPNGLRIDITNNASESLLHSLLGAASHVK